MAYWWVSQNQTYEEEHDGGYLWAPKQNEKAQTFFHWTNLTGVRPADTIFSYVNMRIMAVAVAKGAARNAPRPFTSPAGEAWQRDGWRIDVAYDFLDPPVPIAPIAAELQALLPEKYSPLTRDGTGVQGYLFALPSAAGTFLLQYLGRGGEEVVEVEPPPTTPQSASSLGDTWRKRRPVEGSKTPPTTPGGAMRRSAQAKRIGDRAEQIALTWLRETLPAAEAATLRHVADDGEQPGWDIEYRSNGRLIAVEVKGTTAPSFPAVEITANEWEAAERMGRDCCLLLVTHCMTPRPNVLRFEDPFAKFRAGELRALPMLWRLERI